jgi:hypothetical protein
MRRPVTDIALLAYIAKKNAKVVSYTEATKACKSSSSASRALHQLIGEGILEPKPKLLGLRYVTEYMVTQRGRQVATLALQLTELREAASKMKSSESRVVGSPSGSKKSSTKNGEKTAGLGRAKKRKKKIDSEPTTETLTSEIPQDPSGES